MRNMGQDSWNLQYGKMHPSKTRKGTQVEMHADDSFPEKKAVPGFVGAYKNSKTKVIGKKSQAVKHGFKTANESFTSPQPNFKRRK